MSRKPAITFEKTTLEEALTRYLRYTATLRLVDTFWEDYIIEAQLYTILCDGEPAGNFSIHSAENMLSSFVLDDKYAVFAQDIFTEILEAYSPACAFVATNEELYLSLCMEYQSRVELQAFFFDYVGKTGKSVSQPAHPASWIREATDDDIPDILPLDFFHPLAIGDPEDMIYVLREPDTNKFLGAGHIARMQLARQWGAVGMVTHPNHRKQGVGRSIIMHLTDIAAAQGFIPIAGCWCKNFASKSTLEGCGFATKTRLLKVWFDIAQEEAICEEEPEAEALDEVTEDYTEATSV